MKEKMQYFTKKAKEKLEDAVDWCDEHWEGVSAIGHFIMCGGMAVYFVAAGVAIVQGIIRK